MPKIMSEFRPSDFQPADVLLRMKLRRDRTAADLHRRMLGLALMCAGAGMIGGAAAAAALSAALGVN